MINIGIHYSRVTQIVYAICFSLVLFSSGRANASTTDSLLSSLKTHAQNDTIKVNIIAKLSVSLVYKNLDSAIHYANEGLAIAQSLADDKGQALCLQALGLAYLNKDEYTKALDDYNNALQISVKAGKPEGVSLAYCYIGDVYARQAKYGEATEYYKKSISLSHEINDHRIEGLSLMSMGNLLSDLGNFTDALKYYLNARKLFEQENNNDELPSCLSNIATVYSSLGNYKQSIEYSNQSLAIFLKTGNKMGVLATTVHVGVVYGEMGDFRNAIAKFNYGVILADSLGDKYFKNMCLANIGEAYYNLGSYDTAFEKYTIALHDAKSMNDNVNIAQTENGIGSILVKKGKPAEGIKHLLVAFGIMHDAGMKSPAQDIAINLSNAYEKAHDYSSALKYYKIYAAYSDSLYNEKSDKRIQQLQFDYELGKKENEISLLQKDKVIASNKSQKQSAIIIGTVIGLVFLIVISVLLYRSRDYEKHSKEEIFKQKEAIQQQALKLADLNRFKDVTFSVLSHDLRGPIDSFYSIITLLDEKTITPEEYISLKPEMTAQIASLTILLDNLLKWASGYMKGHIAAKPANTNIYNIVRQNINLVNSLAEKKGITLTNEIPDPTIAFFDAGQIDIVIRNLTMNAIKFTGRNGHVTLSAINDNDSVLISIADNGVGMSKEQIEKLFIPAVNKTTFGTDGEPGTGLGLLLCYEFIIANNGSISVSSEKNKGSTFTIALKKANV